METSTGDAVIRPPDRIIVDTSLLLLDSDDNIRFSISQAMQSRGYLVSAVATIREAREALAASPPAYAILAMRLSDGNGIDLLTELKAHRPDVRALILTRYGNIASAVAATRLGAFDFLIKPTDADAIHNSLVATSHDRTALPESAPPAEKVRRDHIESVYRSCDRNVSETARQLNMHRGTLQRILQKMSRPGASLRG